MGDYLSQPNTEKHSEEGETGKLRYGFSCIQGWRRAMEDAHFINLDIGDGVSIFGVCDGHGGSEVAKYIEKVFIRELKKLDSFRKKDYKSALTECFIKMDQLMQSQEGIKEIKNIKQTMLAENEHEFESGQMVAGSAVNVILITKTEIYCANAGDCRSVMSKKGKSKDLSVDHKPNTPSEKARIEKANGFVEDNRVNGSLGLSRALGDFEYKENSSLKPFEQLVSAVPEVTIEKITPDIDFIILACDGIWDCMRSQDAVNFVKEKIKAKRGKNSIQTVVEDLLDSIIAKDIQTSEGVGTDNMSCLIIEFKK